MAAQASHAEWRREVLVTVEVLEPLMAELMQGAGTATALVLQVLGVIQPNLLAAYSSNLFGIVCVALIKIRHVRPFKRQLILAGQATEPASTS